MKLLNAHPWPEAAISHELPITELERHQMLTLLGRFAGKTPEEVDRRRECFNALVGDWDWYEVGPNGIPRDAYEKVSRRKVTRQMLRTLGEVYKEGLEKQALSGFFSFVVQDLANRIHWIETAKVDMSAGSTPVDGKGAEA